MSHRISFVLFFVAFEGMLMGCATSNVQRAAETSPAETFIERYQHLSRSYDVGIGALYADDAVLSTTYTKMNGHRLQMKLSGADYKRLVPRMMPLAQARKDRSELRDIRFEINDDHVMVYATNVSLSKCFEDTGFTMTLRMEPGQGLLISNVSSHSQSRNLCPDQDPRPLMEPLLKQVEGRLPLMLDDATRLDTLVATSQDLTYEYTILGLTDKAFDANAFVESVRPALLKQVCVTPVFRRILDNGATLNYIYRSESGEQRADLKVGEDDCP